MEFIGIWQLTTQSIFVSYAIYLRKLNLLTMLSMLNFLILLNFADSPILNSSFTKPIGIYIDADEWISSIRGVTQFNAFA